MSFPTVINKNIMNINLDIFPIEIWRVIYEEFIGDYKFRNGSFVKQINIKQKKHLFNIAIPIIEETTTDIELDEPIIRFNQPTIYEIEVKCWIISVLLKTHIPDRRENVNPNSILYFLYNNIPNKIELVKRVFEPIEQKDDYSCILYEEYPNKSRMFIANRLVKNY